jgi:hypothetical protein
MHPREYKLLEEKLRLERRKENERRNVLLKICRRRKIKERYNFVKQIIT